MLVCPDLLDELNDPQESKRGSLKGQIHQTLLHPVGPFETDSGRVSDTAF